MKPIFEEERQFIKEKTGIELPQFCWKHSNKIYLDPTRDKPIVVFKVENGIIKIKKNLIQSTDVTSQITIPKLIEMYEGELNNLEKSSVQKLFHYIKQNEDSKFIVSISGGKDSTVLKNICEKTFLEYEKLTNQKLTIEYSFANTSNETASTYKQVWSEIPKHSENLNILNPKEGYYQWIARKNYFVPSVMVRNCCSTYKEGQVNKFYDKNEKIAMLVGVRASESAKRKEYVFEMDYDFNLKLFGKSNFPKLWTTVAPIIDWDDMHIWLYLIKNNIKFNEQYNNGFERCGCLWCPFQSNYTDLLIEEFYPKQYERWMGVLEKNYKTTDVEKRLKWTLNEWKAGRWKNAISKEHEILKLKPTKERVIQLSEIKGISYELAEKYFNKTCNRCDKKLNSDEVALNLKMFGRSIDLSKAICGKCYQDEFNINRKEYSKMIKGFRDGGCSLF